MKKIKLENALKKVEKAGFEIHEENGVYLCKKAGHDDVKFHRTFKGEKAMCFSCGGVFVPNITQAIAISKKHS